jgi:hypothetical protein
LGYKIAFDKLGRRGYNPAGQRSPAFHPPAELIKVSARDEELVLEKE